MTIRSQNGGLRGAHLVARRAAPVLLALLLLASYGFSQDDDDLPPEELAAGQALPDLILTQQIAPLLERVATGNVAALAGALQAEVIQHASSGKGNALLSLGDLDGDGAPEMLLRWALPVPAWGLYLLSWDGMHWKASRLVVGVEDFAVSMINLEPSVARGLAIIVSDTPSQAAYPIVFEVKDHAASLLWDAEADDSRYQPLFQAQVSFTGRSGAPAELIATGRADPGLLQVQPRGKRGFQARAVYNWNGQAFVPSKVDYSDSPDYTVYRFIAALHLHDYRGAYALVAPAKFLGTDSPSLDAFRQAIQNNWPEFLEDHVFEAPEIAAGATDPYAFLLVESDRRLVYHPIFSADGKLLLVGLSRSQEASRSGDQIR